LNGLKRLAGEWVAGSMELTKTDMAPGKRGAMDAAKGSSAIPYDINAQWFIYNDVADFPEDYFGWFPDFGIYFARPTIRSLGPGSLIRDMSANPAFFIQREYSVSL
jgi:hypothetical protein